MPTLHARTWGLKSAQEAYGRQRRRVPQVVIDYAFMGQEGDESTMPILVVKDCRTRRIFCHSVPCKGIAHEYPVRQLVNDLCLLGYKRLILKSDGEPAILALKAEVKEKIKIDVLCEEPSVGESQSNGEIENANRLMQGQVRTMFDALKARYGFEIDTKHPALKWLIQHSGAIITRFMTGVDGKTAWEKEARSTAGNSRSLENACTTCRSNGQDLSL